MNSKNIDVADRLHESLCDLYDTINLTELAINSYFTTLDERHRPIDYPTARTLINCASVHLVTAFNRLVDLEEQFDPGAKEGWTRHAKDA